MKTTDESNQRYWAAYVQGGAVGGKRPTGYVQEGDEIIWYTTGSAPNPDPDPNPSPDPSPASPLIGVNPVLNDNGTSRVPGLDRLRAADIVVYHGRMGPPPPEVHRKKGESDADFEARKRATEKQTKEWVGDFEAQIALWLRQVPPGKAGMYATDGVRPWKAAIEGGRRVARSLRQQEPPYNGFEGFIEYSSRVIKEGETVAVVSDILGKTAWRNRGDASGDVEPLPNGLQFDDNGALAQPWSGPSWTYSVLSNPRVDISAYVEALKIVGANCTRVFSIELWSGTETPWAAGPSGYDLDSYNPVFYERLEEFLYRCRSAGIVPVISMMDRAGMMQKKTTRGRWHTHPFNRANSSLGFSEVLRDGAYAKGPWVDDEFRARVLDPWYGRTGAMCAKYNAVLEIGNEWRPLPGVSGERLVELAGALAAAAAR